MKKILILGGFGFLGKNLNKVFQNSNYKIYNESRQTGCDILNYDNLLDVVKTINPDIIINSSAHVGGVDYVSKNSADICGDNSLMYINIYKVINAVNKDILLINPLANCSYPGSDVDTLKEENWWGGPMHESVESYGVTKKLAFILSESYKKQYGIKTINILVPNAYGPFDYTDGGRTHAMNGIILRLLESIRTNQDEFIIWGSGTPIREWVYMEDVARFIKYIIDRNLVEIPNPINIGQSVGISIKESVDVVQKILDVNLNIKYDLTKKDGVPKKIMCNKLFNENFGDFTFTTPLVGIENTINYYKSVL
jgi:GDP-L-fucose synthase